MRRTATRGAAVPPWARRCKSLEIAVTPSPKNYKGSWLGERSFGECWIEDTAPSGGRFVRIRGEDAANPNSRPLMPQKQPRGGSSPDQHRRSIRLAILEFGRTVRPMIRRRRLRPPRRTAARAEGTIVHRANPLPEPKRPESAHLTM